MSVLAAGGRADRGERPGPTLRPPRRGPIVASGMVDLVYLDVLRDGKGVTRVRIYDETFAPSEAEVRAVYVFYGTSVGELSGKLEKRGRSAGLRALRAVRFRHYVCLDHSARHERKLLEIIERLHARYGP